MPSLMLQKTSLKSKTSDNKKHLERHLENCGAKEIEELVMEEDIV